MSAEKYISTLMMFGRDQNKVIAKCTFADFMAMSGVSRDFINETGNLKDREWLDKLPSGMLYYYPSNQPLNPIPVPETRIFYRSAKDKRAMLLRRASDKAERIQSCVAKREDETEHRNAKIVEQIAEKLYGYDRANLPWADAGEYAHSMYRGRAAEILALTRA